MAVVPLVVLCAPAAFAQGLESSTGSRPELSPVPNGPAILGSVADSEGIVMDAPGMVIVGERAPETILIDAPDMVIVGKPEPETIRIGTPDLVIVGEPAPETLRIDAPDLVIVGKPETQPNVIDAPDLVIVGKTDTKPVTIDVPGMVIVGETEQERPTGGLGETTPSYGSAPETTETPPANWCVGRFAAHAGRGTGTAKGFAMPFGQYQTLPAKVAAAQCRQELQATIGGATVTLTLTDDPATYSGTLRLGDGAARVLTLRCDADLNLRGSLVAADANLRVGRPIWLIRDGESPSDLPPGC